MNSPMWLALGNHLWQSTLCVACVAVLALFLRKNSANVRYVLWLVASLKFLVPFALLTALGARFPWLSVAGYATESTSSVILFVSDIAAPVAQFTGHGALAQTQLNAKGSSISTVLAIVASIWIVGALLLAGRWLHAWIRLRGVLRESQPSAIEFVIPVRSSASQIEPGVVGIFDPVLLLPEGLEERLTPEQMHAVLAHERCHVARRDNLAAAFHKLVEVMFWFHPLVWWLWARLLDERERACDEYVLANGYAPESYAEGILTVCQHYVESRHPCVAGVSGADLKKRIETIMKKPMITKLSGARRVALAMVGSAAVAGPLLSGSLTSTQAHAATPAAGTSTAELSKTSLEDLSLFSLIAFAYDTTEQQVIGPDWLKQPVRSITAEAPAPNRPQVRKLLADRFGMVVQHDRKEMDGYVLRIDSSGSKLKPHDGDPKQSLQLGIRSLEGTTEFNMLRMVLANRLRAPIVDETSLVGTYDYKLVWGPESLPPGSDGSPNFAVEPAALIKALKEQLGLHLEARPVTVDVIHVVSIRKPKT